MGAVRALLRADLRSRWASTVVLVLLIGVGGGAVLGALAGARRTASAYERMLEEADAADVLINPADGDTDFGAIRSAPANRRRGHGHRCVRRAPYARR